MVCYTLSSRKKIILAAFFITLLMLTVFTGSAFAAPDDSGLPDPDVFKPDKGAFDAANVLITVIVFIAGILASVYFALAVIKIVAKDVKEIINGEADLKSKQGRFMSIIAGFVILLLVISGKWYDVVNVLWTKIIVPIIDTIG